MDDPSFLPKEDAYEVLYSKDKRRKKKRWTDGIAKVKISKEDNDGKNETTNLDFTSGLLSFT